MMAVSIAKAGATLRIGEPKPLFEAAYVQGELWSRNAIRAPDGRFLMMQPHSELQALSRIHVLLNWRAELEKP
jgi:hypothetical protein